MPITVRDLDRKRDRRACEAIDTTFQTDTVFELVTTARRIDLVERTLPAPISKAYSIGEVFAQWARWERGWVALDEAEGVTGFATVQYEPWHGRLNLWFLYVAPEWRRRGVGRALLAAAEQYGREHGATHVWLETSNVNVPGVRAYERLGYSLCGADRLYSASTCPARRRSISRSRWTFKL